MYFRFNTNYLKRFISAGARVNKWHRGGAGYWWMSFKENEGEEGKKRGERFCYDLRLQHHCCWSLDSVDRVTQWTQLSHKSTL